MKRKIIVPVEPCPDIIDMLDAWLYQKPVHVSSNVIESIVEQAHSDKDVRLTRWTHHVPEQKDELLFNIGEKKNEAVSG